MKKILSLLMIVALFYGLSSCSKKSDGVTIRFMSTLAGESPEGPIEKAAIDEYMKENPGVNIEVIPVPINELSKQVITMTTGDKLPDIIPVTANEVYNFIELEILEKNTRDFLGDEFLNNFYDSFIDGVTVDNHVYYVPQFSSPVAVIYRIDRFKEKNLAIPKTLEEFLDVSKKLTEDTDNDGKIDRWGFAFVGTRNGSGGYRALPMFRAFGATDLYQEGTTWKTKFGGKESSEALQFIYDLVIANKSVPPGVLETGYPEAVSLMSTGKASMMLSGSHSFGGIADQNPELADKLASFSFPNRGYPITDLIVSGYGITTSSEHKQEVADFIKFLFNKKNATEFAQKTGRLPARKDVGNSEYFSSPKYSGYMNAIANDSFKPYTLPQKDEFRDVVMEGIHNLIGDKMPMAEVNKKLKERTQEIINQ